MADEKHRQASLKGRGSNEESTSVSSAAVKTEDIDIKVDAELLETGSAAKFRRSAATLHYISMHRSDVQHAVKDTCTNMEKPTQGVWTRLKKEWRCCTKVGDASMGRRQQVEH